MEIVLSYILFFIMPDSCSIPGCKSNADNKPGCSFYKFPANKYFFDKWMENVTNFSRSYKHKWYHRVCELHFRGGKKTPNERIPTIFPTLQSGSESYNKKQNASNIGSQIQPNMTTFDVSIDSTGSTLTDDHRPNYENDNIDYLTGIIVSKNIMIEKLSEDIENFKKIIQSLNTCNNMLKEDIGKMQHSKEQLTSLKKSKGEELYEDITCDEKKLQYYTGFTSRKLFDNLYEYLKDDFPRIKFYNLKPSDPPKPERQSTLSMSIQFLLVLMRLRLNIDGQDLAYRFGVSEATVSIYWKAWVNLLYIRLRQVPIWPSAKITDKYRPTIFKNKDYETVDGILDITEIFIERPLSYQIENEFNLNYKHHNTVKGLVVCSPNGFLIFASDLVPGQLSDKALTLKCGLLDKFTPGRSIMANRSFLIDDECEKKNMMGLPELLAEDEEITVNIANLRIHIERVRNRVKCFSILNGVIPNSLQTDLNSIWHICCRLVNWIDKPLLD